MLGLRDRGAPADSRGSNEGGMGVSWRALLCTGPAHLAYHIKIHST